VTTPEALDEMAEWVVDTAPAVVAAAPASHGLACPLFPPTETHVNLAPGFEAEIERTHLLHTNGRVAPASWADITAITQ
jgi:hypothetical protein